MVCGQANILLDRGGSLELEIIPHPPYKKFRGFFMKILDYKGGVVIVADVEITEVLVFKWFPSFLVDYAGMRAMEIAKVLVFKWFPGFLLIIRKCGRWKSQKYLCPNGFQAFSLITRKRGR